RGGRGGNVEKAADVEQRVREAGEELDDGVEGDVEHQREATSEAVGQQAEDEGADRPCRQRERGVSRTAAMWVRRAITIWETWSGREAPCWVCGPRTSRTGPSWWRWRWASGRCGRQVWRSGPSRCPTAWRTS